MNLVQIKYNFNHAYHLVNYSKWNFDIGDYWEGFNNDEANFYSHLWHLEPQPSVDYLKAIEYLSKNYTIKYKDSKSLFLKIIIEIHCNFFNLAIVDILNFSKICKHASLTNILFAALWIKSSKFQRALSTLKNIEEANVFGTYLKCFAKYFIDEDSLSFADIQKLALKHNKFYGFQHLIILKKIKSKKFSEATRIINDLEGIWSNRLLKHAKAYNLCCQGEFVVAKRCLDQILKDCRWNISAINMLSKLEAKTKNYHNAMQLINVSIMIFPFEISSYELKVKISRKARSKSFIHDIIELEKIKLEMNGL